VLASNFPCCGSNPNYVKKQAIRRRRLASIKIIWNDGIKFGSTVQLSCKCTDRGLWAVMTNARKEYLKRPYNPVLTVDLSTISGEACIELLAYWQAQRGAEPFALWSNFELMDLWRIAPYLIIVDVEQTNGDLRYLYRYMGTKIVEFRRHRNYPDPTGLYFDQADRYYDPAPILEAYERCFEERVPVFMYGHYETEVAKGIHERLIVPLSDRGDAVDKFAVILDRMPPNENNFG
jgi:hypothetical protein